MINRLTGEQPSSAGGLTILKIIPDEYRIAAQDGRLVRDDEHGHYFSNRVNKLYEAKDWSEARQQKVLAWLRDHVNRNIPRSYYKAVLGHDLHVSSYAELFVRHFHYGKRNPFTGLFDIDWITKEVGWWENIGLVSQGKVTTAFRDFESLMLVTDATTMGDFKYHEAGTSATAEANTDTALVTTAISGSLAARVAGNQTNPTAPTYQTVATLPATGTATWQEHGVFNAASGVTLLDRSVLSPTVAVVNLDQVQFTYVLTKNAEA